MAYHTTTSAPACLLKTNRPQITPVTTKGSTSMNAKSTNWSQLAKNLREQQTLKEKIAMLKEKRKQNRNKKKQSAQ